MVKTAKEFYDEHYSDDTVVIMRDYAKMLTDRMYSEEDMKKAFKYYSKRAICNLEYLDDDFKDFMEQFKKQQDG